MKRTTKEENTSQTEKSQTEKQSTTTGRLEQNRES